MTPRRQGGSMPLSTHVVEVVLPEEIELDEKDIQELQVSLQSMMGLEGGRSFQSVVRKLEADGWTTRASFGWCVEARRGRERERAVGRTLDEAFRELYQLTRLDEAGQA